MVIASGESYTVLVSDDGQHVWIFGSDFFGNGHGDWFRICYEGLKDIRVPTEIQRGEIGLHKDVRIIRASCGFDHTVLISDDGRIWTFGSNNCGQLGHGDIIHRLVPEEIKRGENDIPEDVKIVSVSCGQYHTVLLSDDGRIWTFGNNIYGQLGHGDSGYDTNRNAPTKIQRNKNGIPEDVKIIDANCGYNHTVLLSVDGRIWTFGSNCSGQLGHGDMETRNVPTEIQRNINGLHKDIRIIGVSCGEYHTVLLSDDGRIWTFGRNKYGQLGHGDNEDRNVPTEIQRGEYGLHKDNNILGVSCGANYTVLLSNDGRIWTFGRNKYGQLGHGDNEEKNIPTEIRDLSLRQFGSLTKSANKS